MDPNKYSHWKPNTGPEMFMTDIEKGMLAEYRRLLSRLQEEVSKAYERYALKGILTFDEMARYNRITGLTAAMSQLVDDAFKLRSKIIKSFMKRGSAKAYHDILYQAEKIVYAGKAGRSGILTQADRYTTAADNAFYEWVNGNTPGGGGSLDDDLFSLNAHSKAAIPSSVQRALAGTGSTYREFVQNITQSLQSDYGRALRVVHTRGHEMINQAVYDAFHSDYTAQIIKAAGMEDNGLSLIWMHDEPKFPRETHVALHGSAPDRDGLWWSNGYSTRSPGGFAVASENSRCRCYLSMKKASEVTKVSTSAGLITIPAGSYMDWLKGAA